jgi:hypothetical protein
VIRRSCFSFIFLSPVFIVFELRGERNPSGYCGDLGVVSSLYEDFLSL